LLATRALEFAHKERPRPVCAAPLQPRESSRTILRNRTRRRLAQSREAELIATPFVFEFSDELLAEIAREADNGH
jgi:hypothetical protein